MIKLKNIKNQKINLTTFIEILFCTFPISFIVGNFLLSLHLLLFIVFSLYLIKKERLPIKLDNIHWLLVVFFLYLFLLTTIQFQSPGLLKDAIIDWPLEGNPIFKSFILIRFLILIIIVDILFSNKKLNLEKFFIISLICTSFVSVDLLIQYFLGFDIFGLEATSPDRFSGPFGKEYIAGSYLQKFSLFGIFYVFQIYRSKKINNLLLIFLIALHALPTLVAGNRMSLILLVFGFFIIFILVKKLRFAIVSGMVVFSALSFILLKNNEQLKNTYEYLFESINLLKPVDYVFRDTRDGIAGSDQQRKLKKKVLILRTSGHGAIYRTSISMWEEKPLFGFGLKSFRIKCWEILPRINNRRCSTHSHNYYLELLSETGLVGTSLMSIFFLILLKRSYYHIRKKNKELDPNTIMTTALIVVAIIEIWPLRSSGSFFTTWNASFFWLNAAMLLAVTKKNSLTG